MNFFGPMVGRSFGQVLLPLAKSALGNVMGSLGKIAIQGLGTVAGLGLNALKNMVQGQDSKQTLQQFKQQTMDQARLAQQLGQQILKRKATSVIEQMQDQLVKKVFQ